MAKVLADFYYRWVQNRIRETFTVSGTISATKEWIEVDTTGSALNITLPDVVANDILNGKKIQIIDQGNAFTNHITLSANPNDGTTIQGLTPIQMDKDGQRIILELVEKVWIITGNSDEYKAVGNLNITNNEDVTTFPGTGIYVDIEGDVESGELDRVIRTDDLLTYVGFKSIQLLVMADFSLVRNSGSAARNLMLGLFIGGELVKEAPITMNGVIVGFGFTGVFPFDEGETIEIRVKNDQDTAAVVFINYSLTIVAV